MSEEINMENIAYAEAYQKARNKMESILFSQNCYRGERQSKLTDDLILIIKNYVFSANDTYPYNLSGSENDVVNKDGKVIYTYRCHDDDGAFCTVFTHQNGKRYMVFRRELYGYSVFDLSSMEDFHYMPAASFPQGETFIWCGIDYNPLNNILAVTGCFWACPSGVYLADFSNPLQTTAQIDIYSIIDKGYEKYDDVDFIAWEGTNLILATTLAVEPYQTEHLTIRQEEYMEWLNGDTYG